MSNFSDADMKISPETIADLQVLYEEKKDSLMKIAEQGSASERWLAKIAIKVGGGFT